MGRGERICSKDNSKGQVCKRNVKSDDSDEDYMLEEDEIADQSDELESLVGDASDEESLRSFVVEEEEENVKKVVRQRSNGRRKHGIRISKKRNRVVSDEEIDEDYDYEEEEEEDNDADVQKSRKRSIGRRKNGTKSSKKRERVAYDEDYDYKEEEEEDNDADVQKSHKRSTVQKTNVIKSSKKRERIVSDEEDDEDYDYKEEEDDDIADVDSIDDAGGGSGDDDDYNDADVQKSRKRSIGRRKNEMKSSKKRERTAFDEEDDEDYDYKEDDNDAIADVDSIDDCGSGSGDDDDDYNDADVQKSRKRSIGRRKNGTKSSKKRERIASDEEDDDDYDYKVEDNDAIIDVDSIDDGGGGSGDDDDDYNDADVQISHKRSIGQRKNGMKKREMIAADEEDDEDYVCKEDNVVSVSAADVDIGGGDGGSGDDDDDDYNDEDDSEEDEDDEFTPEGLDFLDEEEEHPSSKGRKGRSYLQKKGPVRSRKRKSGAKLLKKAQTNKRQGSSRSSKPTSDKSRKSMKKALPSRGRCKTRFRDRLKKAKPCSDSDFVSSESSDFELTISEEEREQVREADDFCRRSRSNLRSSKQDQQDAAGNQQKRLPRRKGKEKVGEIKSDVGKQVCGICLSEEGKNTTRGTLDCCSHFFCFACIMEWSKVESRCPLCKQRFSTISKPGRSATRIDLRNVVIHVPERDQVYQPSEEELRNYLDPYENVICTECHEGGEDALMLLCDICDSPAHTYCVGLGREVPEGNWYCEGCRPSALGSTSSQAQDLTPTQRLNSSSLEDPSFESIAEIDLNITIPETPMTPVNGSLASPRPPSGGSLQAPPHASSVGVSTLSGRRRVHRLQFQLMSGNRRTNFSVPWEDRAAQSSSLGISTREVGTSYHAEYVDRLQEIPSSAAQNRESFLRRPSLLRGQALQAPPAADRSLNGYVHSGGVGGINLERSCSPEREWLQPCPSRLNMGSETSTSPWYNKDVDQNTAKQQIHTLVKSHVKNLCRDMELAYDTYKQITISTVHTILAACGLEHSRREVHEMRPPICLHYEALVGPQMSLIKGCCQACFDSFVREVVRMVMDVKVKAPEHLSFRNY